MTKRLFLAVTFAAIMSVCALPLQAQFGKSLKKLGKSVSDVAASTVGDMAADMAADKVASKTVEWMDTNNSVASADSEYTKRLEALLSKKYTSVDGVALNYKVYENNEVNILACANGSIRVYSGMMDKLTDDELLAVVTIQIGHIVNKDARDALMKIVNEGNASNAGAAQLDKMLSMSGDKFGSIINELIQVPYSDEQNKKADTYAYDLLKKNNADVSGLVSALNKFAEMESNDLLAEEDESVEASGASKYTLVNSNNSIRASLISSRI